MSGITVGSNSGNESGNQQSSNITQVAPADSSEASKSTATMGEDQAKTDTHPLVSGTTSVSIPEINILRILSTTENEGK